METTRRTRNDQSPKDPKTQRRGLFGRPGDETERVAHAVIGAAIEVHRHLGAGHIELMYERALAIELELRAIPFVRQAPSLLEYKGTEIGEFRLDLVVADCVVVELKAIESISSTHVAQCLAYLAVTELELALLLNFNVPVLSQGIRRVIRRF
jgi:GxxExxY protein